MDMSLDRRAVEAVEHHPAVRRVRLVGSRAAGTATAVSDWDFAVETDDFPAVARDIGRLVAVLEPLAQQWDRLSETQCWMLILPGPVKVDFIFEEPHHDEPPWRPEPNNLAAIDAHFWDWALWLLAKRVKGKSDLVASELHKMFDHILHPMGVRVPPDSLDAAVASYLRVRAELERNLNVTVPLALQREAVRSLRENGVAVALLAAGARDGQAVRVAVEFTRVVPILRIFDVDKAKEFYVDYLGFTVDWEHRFEDGMPLYMQVSRGDLVLHLSEHHGDATPGSTVYVQTRGVREYHAELREKEYAYLRPGVEEDELGVWLSLLDPFGNQLRLNEQPG
jgi:ribosomal-protein-alanine N-acetyltransferase